MASKNRGEPEGNNSSPRVPLVPSPVGTKLPAGSQPAPSPSQLRSGLPTGSGTGHVPQPQQRTGASDAHVLHPADSHAQLYRGSQNLRSVEGTSPRAPPAASHRANPAHVSRDSYTFVGALPEQPANAKGSAGRIHTQGQGAAPRCCTSLAAFHSPIPPSPTHISFVPPFLIPTFLCCPPRHPPLYPTACPSTLFSKFTSQPSFLWDLLQSQEQELKWGNTSLGALSLLQSPVLV